MPKKNVADLVLWLSQVQKDTPVTGSIWFDKKIALHFTKTGDFTLKYYGGDPEWEPNEEGYDTKPPKSLRNKTAQTRIDKRELEEFIDDTNEEEPDSPEDDSDTEEFLGNLEKPMTPDEIKAAAGYERLKALYRK